MGFATALRFEDGGRSWGLPPVRVTPLWVISTGPPPKGPGGGRRWWLVGLVVAMVASLLSLTPVALQVFSPSPGGDAPPAGADVEATLGAMPLSFIENRGQVDGPVSYYVQSPSTSLFFAPCASRL